MFKQGEKAYLVSRGISGYQIDEVEIVERHEFVNEYASEGVKEIIYDVRSTEYGGVSDEYSERLHLTREMALKYIKEQEEKDYQEFTKEHKTKDDILRYLYNLVKYDKNNILIQDHVKKVIWK